MNSFVNLVRLYFIQFAQYSDTRDRTAQDSDICARTLRTQRGAMKALVFFGRQHGRGSDYSGRESEQVAEQVAACRPTERQRGGNHSDVQMRPGNKIAVATVEAFHVTKTKESQSSAQQRQSDAE